MTDTYREGYFTYTNKTAQLKCTTGRHTRLSISINKNDT